GIAGQYDFITRFKRKRMNRGAQGYTPAHKGKAIVRAVPACKLSFILRDSHLLAFFQLLSCYINIILIESHRTERRSGQWLASRDIKHVSNLIAPHSSQGSNPTHKFFRTASITSSISCSFSFADIGRLTV